MSGFYIKLIAIITMLIDHIAAVFSLNVFSVETYYMMRYIGRVAFPIFCFLIVEGAIHTRNIWKYLMRLFVFALISELPFDMALRREAFSSEASNVFFTLFLGLFAIAVTSLMTGESVIGGERADEGDARNSVGESDAQTDDIKHMEQRDNRTDSRNNSAVQYDEQKYTGDASMTSSIQTWISGLPVAPRLFICLAALVAACMVSYVLKTDYTVGGVIIIYSMYILHDRPVSACAAMAVLLVGFFGGIEAWGLFAIPLILLYNKKRGPNNVFIRYLFYVFYPLHLTVLWCILKFVILQ